MKIKFENVNSLNFFTCFDSFCVVLFTSHFIKRHQCSLILAIQGFPLQYGCPYGHNITTVMHKSCAGAMWAMKNVSHVMIVCPINDSEVITSLRLMVTTEDAAAVQRNGQQSECAHASVTLTQHSTVKR